MGTVTRMELRKISELRPYANNAKLHPPEQIEKLRASFREFGMIVPIGIDSQGNVVYGHGRLMAAQAEGWETVPTVTIENLTEEQRRAFVHADNLLGETGYDGPLTLEVIYPPEPVLESFVRCGFECLNYLRSLAGR